MKQETSSEMEKQGWMKQWVTAVFRNLFAGLCLYGMSISPHEAQMFMNYTGFGVEEAMMAESLARMKWNEAV